MIARRFAFAPCLIASFAVLGLAAASSAFTPNEQRCRDTMAQQGTRLAKTVAKRLTACHKKRDAGKLSESTNCNDIASSGAAAKISGIEQKMSSQVVARCAGAVAADLGYTGCPSPCNTIVPAITSFADAAACLACVVERSGQDMTATELALPAVPLVKNDRKCRSAIGSNGRKHFTTILKERRRCQKDADAAGATDTNSCAGADPRTKIAKVRNKVEAALDKSCGDANLLAVASCSDFNLTFLKACVFDDTGTRGENIFEAFYGLAAGSSTTTTTLSNTTTTSVSATTTTMATTTTTLPTSQDPQCPNKSEVFLFAGAGRTCTTNADCPVGSCDSGIGRCVTATDLDTGWTGISHDADINDEAPVVVNLLCPGPASPTCGDCQIAGINPEGNNCRCESGQVCATNADCPVGTCFVGPNASFCVGGNRVICDQPFQTDSVNCGGATCNCYLGAPLPLSAGNTPACVVNRLGADLSGTVNVDTGNGATSTQLRSVVATGIDLFTPCPYCTGDVTPRDGIRDGVCVGGDDDGLPCDVDSPNTTFPAPGGDGHSLDCFPNAGLNVSGAGLRIEFTQSTGTTTLSSGILCGFPPVLSWNCPCSVCTNDSTAPCSSNADCSGGGSCERIGNQNPNPDLCNPLFTCQDIGGGEGECASGPDELSCDGIVRANNTGFISCFTNADCDPTVIGVDAGNCTLSKRRKCFLDPIVATGSPDPGTPVGAAAFCIPPTANSGINGVAGLPGPGRVRNQSKVTYFCASNPSVSYTPGVGGCP